MFIFSLCIVISEGSEGQQEVPKSTKRSYHCLPDLGHNSSENKNSKKAIQVLKSKKTFTL
jgi:hypothetical protein